MDKFREHKVSPRGRLNSVDILMWVILEPKCHTYLGVVSGLSPWDSVFRPCPVTLPRARGDGNLILKLCFISRAHHVRLEGTARLTGVSL